MPVKACHDFIMILLCFSSTRFYSSSTRPHGCILGQSSVIWLSLLLSHQRDIWDVRMTRAVRSAECQMDHRLIRAFFNYTSSSLYQNTQRWSAGLSTVLNLNVMTAWTSSCKHLRTFGTHSSLTGNATDKWKQCREFVMGMAKEVLNPPKRRQMIKTGLR